MRKPGEIRSLTGLRGVAACVVVLYHFFEDVPAPGPAGIFIRHGYMAVDLFFVLSGFVMAITYGGEFQAGFRWEAYGRFLIKRLGRVYPLYVVITIIWVLVLSTEGGGRSWPAIVVNLLMLQGLGLAGSLAPTTWSISAELVAYLLFPLLTAVVLFRRWRLAALAGLVAVAGLGTLALLPGALLHEASRMGPLDIFVTRPPYATLRCLAGFILGLIAWRLATVPAVARFAAGRGVGSAVALAVLVLLAVADSDVALVVLFVPLIISLATGTSWAARVLAGRVAHWLGTVSYSIYLVHRLVLDTLRGPAMGATGTACLLALVFLLAVPTFYVIERPGRRLSRSLAWKKKSVIQPTLQNS